MFDWAAYLAFAMLGAIASLGAIALLLANPRYLPVDRPNWRSSHTGSIPRCGGLGIFMATAVAVMLARFAYPDYFSGNVLLASSGALVLLLVSLWDDWKPLPVIPRLLIQCFVTMAALWIIATPLPLLLPATLAVVWMTNLFNFMDGADGLAGGMAVGGFAAYGVGACQQAPVLAMICFILAGAAAGFLRFNFAPAKVFLGDAGSIPLGFLSGVLGLSGWQMKIWPLWYPLLVFSPFIVDSTLTLLRRALNREMIWRPHREHAYQHLIRMGWPHRRVAVLYYGLILVTAAIAWTARQASPEVAIYFLFAVYAVLIGLYAVLEIKWRKYFAKNN